jgi:hypothetical protein
VHSIFADQTPQLLGEGSRVVFGSASVQPPESVVVMEVDEANDRVRLATGQSQGVRPGSQFAIYPPDALVFAEGDGRLAVVTLKELGAADSWARIEGRDRDDPIEPGAQAILLDPGSARLQRSVALFTRDDLEEDIDQATALASVEAALAEQGKGWVVLAGEEDAVDYQVAVNENSEYEIWDPAGNPVPNLRPPLKIDRPGVASEVVQRLVHLTKYRNILQLDNLDALSPLAGALEVELMVPQPGYVPGDPVEPRSIEEPGGTPTFTAGERVVLSIKNRSPSVLNVTVLAMQPDWSISQFYPPMQDYLVLDPGAEVTPPPVIRVHLPDGYEAGCDVLKVFATVGPASYKWLELPVLDRPPVRSDRLRTMSPANPLEALMAALTDERQEQGLRNLDLEISPSHEWTMAQVEVRQRKV